MSSSTSEEGNGHSPYAVPFLSQSHPIAIKLTESNYLVWKQQIMSTIRGYELESYLLEDQEKPPHEITGAGGIMKPNPAFLAWRRQDQLLASWIQSSLTENIMVLMVGLTTTCEI